MEIKSVKKYQNVILPKRKWLDVDIKGLWQYRDLYLMYIKRDIVTQYKQTIFGPLWYVIQPLLTTVMYMFVFGGLAKIPTDGIPQPLFYLSGITLWNYFSTTFTGCCNVFGDNSKIFGKVYFPRLVVPLSTVTSNLLRMFMQLMMFVIIYIGYVILGQFGLRVGPTIVLFPVLILMIGLHAMSWGLLISSWTVKYHDLIFLVSFGVQLLMFTTPVIYPLSFASDRYQWILNLNPLTPVFEAFKYSTLGVGTFSVSGLLYSFVFLCITMFLAIIIFNRTEQKFMDTV